MATLPASTDFTGSSVTQGGAKTYMGTLRTFIADLLGTDSGNKPAARAALGAAELGANSDITSLTALSSINGGQVGGHRNRLINGNFSINQLALSGSITLTAGQYGHDGFKGGAGGCTYTFATGTNVTTLTITAGTLVQVVNGKNLLSGAHILGWDGTAQARIDGGSYGSSPKSGTAVGGVNQTVEWGTGTLALAQYEPGSTRTPFEMRDDELQRCRAYFRKSYDQAVAAGAVTAAGQIGAVSVGTAVGATLFNLNFDPPMNSIPTIVAYSPLGAAGYCLDVGGATNRSVSYTSVGQSGAVVQNATSVTANVYHTMHYTASARL